MNESNVSTISNNFQTRGNWAIKADRLLAEAEEEIAYGKLNSATCAGKTCALLLDLLHGCRGPLQRLGRVQ